MIRAVIGMYGWKYPRVLVYMLQSTEYRARPFLAWYWRTQNFGKVMYRRRLEPTRPARLLLLVLRAGMFAQIVAGFVLIGMWHYNGFVAGWQFGLALILSYPIAWAHLAVVPLLLGRWFIIIPRERRLIKKSEGIFAGHKGLTIAVAGSYGKTSMKELLLTVLGEGRKVAATPANKNVSISHARFAANLDGDEDILIVEYGEGRPGDVKRFAETTHPTHAVITGVAPAHLDRYKTVAAAGRDIFAVAGYLQGKHVYVNAESPDAQEFLQKDYHTYSSKGALDWKVKNIELAVTGTGFQLTKGKKTLRLTSGLLGKHQVGPLALAAALGLELGLTEKQVVAGIAKTVPFEHRMQPYALSGAWIIDDTYNGNIEGVRAGLQLLAALPALKRKLYVTPGLVDQGKDANKVHQTMGELIAEAKPDVVVLMQNSAAAHIKAGLDAAGYKGELTIEPDPLLFYANLSQFVAAGDLVLMQNDWTDNYV
jgi:UDP-N-acetylmuramyl pentapeptide synthase